MFRLNIMVVHAGRAWAQPSTKNAHAKTQKRREIAKYFVILYGVAILRALF
jgi:hypothetical protein